jgi:tRNA (cmo5U34)-methyltransferase
MSIRNPQSAIRNERRSAMSVASHLGIRLSEYDKRIRTFIPRYEEMLDETAHAIDPHAKAIVDLGIGTGALAARCLQQAPSARVTGIDADADILALARRRLGESARLVTGDFVRADLPRTDAVVASFALHHVRTRNAKLRVFRRVRAALRPRGVFLSADCHPSGVTARWARQRAAWLAHLRRSYSARESAKLLDAWRGEDVYVPLDAECELLQRAGFRNVDVVWRREAFAVIACQA